MAQFVACDPNAEVSGHIIGSIVAAMGDRAKPILAAHNLFPIDPDAWYSLKDWLAVFRELATGDFSAMLDLVSIGMRIPEHAGWPPDVTTLEDAIQSVDQMYHLNHRGREIGSYQVTQVGDRAIEVVCDSPYPCDCDYGILYSIARLYQPHGTISNVVHNTKSECRKHGGNSCTYLIGW